MTAQDTATAPSDDFEQADRSIAGRCANADPSVEPVTPCHPPEVHVRIAVKDEEFRLVTGLPYELTVGGQTFTGTVDRVIDHVVAQASGSAALLVTFGENDVYRWDLQFEAMDPLALDTGAAARLRSLMPLETQLEDDNATAIAWLRDAFRLEDGETIDEPTRTLIGQLYSAEEKPLKGGGWTVPESLAAEAAEIAAALGRVSSLPAVPLLEEDEA